MFIDISHWNSDPPKRPIDWARARAAGVEQAYIKATESTYFTDGWFAQHWAGAASVGILRGAYHFFRGNQDGRGQARYFLNVVGADRGELPLAVDVEAGAAGVSQQTFTDRLLHCLHEIEFIAGARPIIYTSQPRWDSLTTRPAWIANYVLWLAAYPGPPVLPAGATGYWLHQYTDRGQVDGIEGGVDLNREVNPPTPEPPTESPMGRRLKLSPHHLMGGGTVSVPWAQHARGMALVGDYGAGLEAPAGSILMGRDDDPGYPQFGGQKFDVNIVRHQLPPMEAARRYVAATQRYIDLNPHITVWGPPIEQHPLDDAAMAWLGAFSYEFARVMHAQGKRVGVGGWATGTPEFRMWDNWTMGLLASRHFGAYQWMHRYGPAYILDANKQPQLDRPDLSNGLRYRADYAYWSWLGFPDVRVLLEECGADDAGGEHCYKRFFGSLPPYWNAHLRHLAVAFEADFFLDLGAVFTCAEREAWECFNFHGTDIVDSYIEPLAASLPKEIIDMQLITLEINDPELTIKVNQHIADLVADVNTQGRCLPYGQGTGPQPLFWAITGGAGLALRDANGQPAHHPVYAPTGSPAGVVQPGTRIPIYAENITAGAFTRRASITPDGLNLWMGTSSPTYRRE